MLSQIKINKIHNRDICESFLIDQHNSGATRELSNEGPVTFVI
jgi:hypothetical protein